MPWKKKNLNWNNVSWGILNLVFKVFVPPSTLCCNSSIRFPELVRSLFLLLDDFLCCLCDLSMKYFDTYSFLVSTMGVILVFSIFSLFVESNTLLIRTSLHLYHSFILVWSSFWKLPPPFCVLEKVIWNTLYMKQQTWTYQIYFEADR